MTMACALSRVGSSSQTVTGSQWRSGTHAKAGAGVRNPHMDPHSHHLRACRTGNHTLAIRRPVNRQNPIAMCDAPDQVP